MNTNNFFKFSRIDRPLSKTFKDEDLKGLVITFRAISDSEKYRLYANLILKIKPKESLIVASIVNEYEALNDLAISSVLLGDEQFLIIKNKAELLILLNRWQGEGLVLSFLNQNEFWELPQWMTNAKSRKVSILGFEEAYLALFGSSHIVCFISDSHESIEVWSSSENMARIGKLLASQDQ